MNKREIEILVVGFLAGVLLSAVVTYKVLTAKVVFDDAVTAGQSLKEFNSAMDALGKSQRDALQGPKPTPADYRLYQEERAELELKLKKVVEASYYRSGQVAMEDDPKYWRLKIEKLDAEWQKRVEPFQEAPKSPSGLQ